MAATGPRDRRDDEHGAPRAGRRHPHARADGRAASIIVGRADDGRRPGVASRVLGRARAVLDAGDDDSPRDAVSRRGGALSSRGAHARRAPAPDRHAGRATPEPRAAAPGGARDRSAPGGGRAGRARRDRRRPALRRPARRAGARGDVRRTRGSRGARCRRGERARRVADAREHLRRDPARPRRRDACAAVPGPPRARAGRRPGRHRRTRLAQDVRELRGRQGHRSGSPLRRGLRPARRQRRGEDDHHQDALRAAGAERGRGAPGGRGRGAALRGGPAAGRLHVAEVLALRRPHDRREPRLLRRRLPGAARAARGAQALGARLRRPSGQGRPAHGQPARRLEAAGGLRRRDHARAARAVPRRADVGRGPDRPPRVLGHDQPARGPGHRDPRHHALSRRSRAVQPAGIHGGRRAGGRGHAEWREGRAGRPRARGARRRPAARGGRAEDGARAVARVALRRSVARHRRGRRAGGRARPRGEAGARGHPGARGEGGGLLAGGRLPGHRREGRRRRLTADRMRRIIAQARKELTQLLRDPLALGLALGLPVGLTALMGTSVSLTVTDIPIVIQDFDQTQMSRRYADAFRTSLTYRVVSLPPATSPETMLAGGRARAAVIIPEHFEREIRRHRPVEAQVLVDATDGNTAQLIRGSAGQITRAFAQPLGGAAVPAIQTATRLWFNPGREPRKFYGPGFLVLGLSIFPTVLAALAMSREGEQKTILQVYVSSISAHEVLLGKILAGMVIGFAQCMLLAVLMFTLFGLRFAGDPTPVIVGSVLFVFCVMSFGSLVGAAIPNQAAAVQAVALGGFLLSFLLSGLIFPIENIPGTLRWISNFVQARYYVLIVRDAFLQGGGWPAVWWAVLAIGAIGLVFYGLAWRAMRRMQVKA